jgi:hypothetical protein
MFKELVTRIVTNKVLLKAKKSIRKTNKNAMKAAIHA